MNRFNDQEVDQANALQESNTASDRGNPHATDDGDARPAEIEVTAKARSEYSGPRIPRRGRLVEGAYYGWHGKIVELVAAQSQSRVFIRERDTGDVHVIDPIHLAPFSGSDDPFESTQHGQPLGVTREEWDDTHRRQRIVAHLIKGRISRLGLERAAKQLGISLRHVRRLIARYANAGGFDALLPRRSGPQRGHLRLSPQSVAVMERVVQKRLRKSPNIPLGDIVHSIKSECGKQRVERPSRATIARYFRVARQSPDFMPPTDRKLLLDRVRGVKKHFEAERSLQTVQMDHTVGDVLIVDARDHLVIGRPVITLALDLHTRCILGMNVGLEAPSILAVALCLTHAVAPKEAWLKGIGCHGQWPMFGIPEMLHMDNGREFHSAAFLRGCDRYDINVCYRPPGTPRFGGAVERVIGTFMRRLRLLPGATYSDIFKRRPPNAEKEACFTLDDVRLFLANEINRYHLTVHSTLGVSPLMAWERAWRGKANELLVPPRPQNALKFLMDFLPMKLRVITREGINLFGLEYWSPELGLFIAPDAQRAVRFDPRDLSQVYVEVDDSQTIIVPLRDTQMPRLSIYEWREIRRRDRVNNVDGAEVSRLVEENERLIESRSSTLRDRRRRERQKEWRAQPCAPQPIQAELDAVADAIESDDVAEILSYDLPE